MKKIVTWIANKDPLHEAVRKRNYARINELVEMGFSVNEKNDEKKTPFHIAIENTNVTGRDCRSQSEKDNDIEIIRYLKKHGADITLLAGSESCYNLTTDEVVRQLIMPPLFFAAGIKRDVNLIDRLVQQGENINDTPYEYSLLLFVASSLIGKSNSEKKDFEDIIRHLIKKYRVDVKAAGPKGQTILHLLIFSASVELIEFLVNEAGVDIRAKNRKGLTAYDEFIQHFPFDPSSDKYRDAKRNERIKALINPNKLKHERISSEKFKYDLEDDLFFDSMNLSEPFKSDPLTNFADSDFGEYDFPDLKMNDNVSKSSKSDDDFSLPPGFRKQMLPTKLPKQTLKTPAEKSGSFTDFFKRKNDYSAVEPLKNYHERPNSTVDRSMNNQNYTAKTIKPVQQEAKKPEPTNQTLTNSKTAPSTMGVSSAPVYAAPLLERTVAPSKIELTQSDVKYTAVVPSISTSNLLSRPEAVILPTAIPKKESFPPPKPSALETSLSNDNNEFEDDDSQVEESVGWLPWLGQLGSYVFGYGAETVENQHDEWRFDAENSYYKSKNAKTILYKASPKDFDLINENYKRFAVPNMEIDSVEIIMNTELKKKFKMRVKTLESRSALATFNPTWQKESNAHERRKTHQIFEKLTFKDSRYPNVKFLFGWHGTGIDGRKGILDVGYANVTKNDDGFIGKGVYSSREAEYAYRVYSNGALFFNVIATYSPYPAVEGDMKKLQGTSNHGAHDLHVSCMLPPNGKFSYETSVYFPCNSDHYQYIEMVVFHEDQCLPYALVKLKPMLLKSVPLLPDKNFENTMTSSSLHALAKQNMNAKSNTNSYKKDENEQQKNQSAESSTPRKIS